ncbi:DUF3948 family protein, partial [Bacillus nitratireducens]
MNNEQVLNVTKGDFV